jgi:peptidoglycan/xylan/chitin deacetylase (PgdA/CDA1 family)
MPRHCLLLLCGLSFLVSTTALAQQPAAAPPATQPLQAQPAPAQPAPSQAAVPAQPAGNTQPAPAQSTPGKQVTFNSVYVDQPYIAITFDDGPHATLTPKLLDMLAARRLKATFFIIGQNGAEYPDIMKRIVREGHELANHSWSHPNLAKMSDDAVRAQMQKTDEVIQAAAGKRTTLMRPPYGSITPRQKEWINQEFGYRTIIWDVDPFDWRRPGAGVIRDRIVNQTQPGSIILVHDIHPGSIDAMPETFDQLTAKGFKFATVSELLAMAKAGARPTSTPSPRATASPGTSPRPATTPARASGSPSGATRPAGSPAAAPRTTTSPAAAPAAPASTPPGTPNG